VNADADAGADADADRLAEKYHVKRVHQVMDEQFKEMGMTSVVFVCYTRSDGKLAIDAYVICYCRGRSPTNSWQL
jgi:hypothetical protein